MQSADRAGVEDAGDDDGQDGAGLSAGHRALQPRREGAPGHQPGGAAQGESVRHLGGVHQVITFTTICRLKLISVYCCRTKHENEPGRFAKLLLRLPGRYDDMNRIDY